MQLLDTEVGMEFFPGKTMYQSFLKRFEENELSTFVTETQEIFEQKNWSELRRLSHSMKSSSGYIGATKCRELAEAVEHLCNSSSPNVDEIQPKIKELWKHIEELKRYLETESKKNQSKAVGKAGEQGELNLEHPFSDTLSRLDSGSLMAYTTVELNPPVITFEEPDLVEEDEEIDLYDELNKQWKCVVW